MTDIKGAVDLPWIQAEYEITHRNILLAGAFICENDNNPVELLEILGIKNDLQKLRVCRRLAKNGTSPRMQRP